MGNSIKTVVVSNIEKVGVLKWMLQVRRLLRGLGSQGWSRSVVSGSPVGGDGNSVPWYTYSAIDFLSGRVKKDMRVFEYGAGASTVWWSERVAKIDSVENNRGWFESIRDVMPGNSSLDLVEDPVRYVRHVEHSGSKYDVVVIDGRARCECSEVAVSALSEKGVIVWDNSDRPRYSSCINRLELAGYSVIRFTGLGPGLSAPSETSVIYRQGSNCMGI